MFVQMLLIRFVIYNDYQELKQSHIKPSNKIKKKLSSYESNWFSYNGRETYTNITTSRISINSDQEESYFDSEISQNVIKVWNK